MMLRHLILMSILASTLTACASQNPVMLSQNTVKNQAYLPPDWHPSYPCGSLSTQAYLPPDAFPAPSPSSNPCGCGQSMGPQAILPPDATPKPGC